MVYGIWYMENGIWYMVYGIWYIVYSVCYMENGMCYRIWQMVFGPRSYIMILMDACRTLHQVLPNGSDYPPGLCLQQVPRAW